MDTVIAKTHSGLIQAQKILQAYFVLLKIIRSNATILYITLNTLI